MQRECTDQYIWEIEERASVYSKNEKATAYAMFELYCLYNTAYGIGHAFKIIDAAGNAEVVTINKIIGEGGSKKALLLEDGRVIAVPNADPELMIDPSMDQDIDHIASIAQWWPNTVHDETQIIIFLESINIPCLNKKKRYLVVPSTEKPGVQYHMPIMLSDSFQQYAQKGWFVHDIKRSKDLIPVPPGDVYWFGKDDINDALLDSNIIKNAIKPLIQDLWILTVHQFFNLERQYHIIDALNVVLIEQNHGPFELHYFGLDFGGRSGLLAKPSRREILPEEYAKIHDAYNYIAFYAFFMIEQFFLGQFYTLFQDDNNQSYSEQEERQWAELANGIAEKYSNREFIHEVLLEAYPPFVHSEL